MLGSPNLPVTRKQVTTPARQAANAKRRKNDAHYACLVPGCNSTFVWRSNLRVHTRRHTEARPYVCEWPGCNKDFVCQDKCLKHQTIHKAELVVCPGCGRGFSRIDVSVSVLNQPLLHFESLLSLPRNIASGALEYQARLAAHNQDPP
ncbi:hypothetical protein DENSPDRAFT_780650 [Dentipellis sp. KUC8613]|nr:hypothetical protein DENSPDRAFT_780650 [Dentipellis sp. KUC8613]